MRMKPTADAHLNATKVPAGTFVEVPDVDVPSLLQTGWVPEDERAAQELVDRLTAPLEEDDPLEPLAAEVMAEIDKEERDDG